MPTGNPADRFIQFNYRKIIQPPPTDKTKQDERWTWMDRGMNAVLSTEEVRASSLQIQSLPPPL